ncbi:MAG TPA: rhodanese-like domain-containing protein, partial [Phycisphaerales bacterium]|nr:rhodanese-like domain-containing protein [Phycisphaerales bacterium]
MPYAHPEVLVDPQWLKEHYKDANIRVIEVDMDPKMYAAGHVPGAIGLDWTKDLQEPVRRDIPSPRQFEKLMGERGVGNDHTVILYGDSANWFAAYAFWVFKLYGHK